MRTDPPNGPLPVASFPARYETWKRATENARAQGFTSIGNPDTFRGWDEALGLPPGTTLEFFAAGGRLP